MINVRAAANAAIQAINPNILAMFYASTGNAVDAAGKQAPSYAAGVQVSVQKQAVTARDLEHIEDLSLEGVITSIRMWGNTQGVVRVTQEGGDLLYFPEVPAGTPRVWKVVKVVETWPTWSHLVVNLQTDPAPPA